MPEVSMIDELLSTKEGRRQFLPERAIRTVAKQIEDAMKSRGLSRSDLAAALGRTKGWVTQLLDGDKNKTIRTVAYVFAVMDMQFETGYTPIPLGRPVGLVARDIIPWEQPWAPEITTMWMASTQSQLASAS